MTEFKKILIIDDEPDFTDTLADRLSFEGYQIYVGKDGNEGMELARKHRPHLIILDIVMPHMNGYQTWTFLQRDPELAKIPLFVLSAKLQATDHFWKQLMPPDDYIIKTAGMDKVVQRIKQKI